MSMARKMAGPVALLAISGRGTRRPSIVSRVDLPHSGVGEVMPRRGKMSKVSKTCAATLHSAQISARVRRHDDEALQRGGDLRKQRGALDGIGPRLVLRPFEPPARKAVVLAIAALAELRRDQLVESGTRTPEFSDDSDALVGGRIESLDGAEELHVVGLERQADIIGGGDGDAARLLDHGVIVAASGR